MRTHRRTRSTAGLLGAGLMVAAAAALWGFGCAPVTDVINGNGNGNGNGNNNVNDNADGNGGGEPVAGLPLATFTTDDFSGSGTCAPCHGGLTDDGGNDVSIDAHWRSTIMANATADPLFQASVSVEVEQAPAAMRTTIEDVCAKCHMPMARTQGVTDGTGTLMLDDGFLSPANALHEAAMDGVSCTLCHQITDAFVGTVEDGVDYQVDTDTDAPDRPLYGPYADPVQPEIMQASVGYHPVGALHIEEAGLCATCHTLFTPTLNAQGEIVGEFPEQVPFLEWQHSDFGDGQGEDRTCQDCHMPTADGAAAISRVPGNLDGREPFYQHHFVGGNVVVLRMLRDNIEDLGLTASTEQFNDTIGRTESLLQNDTADLSVVEDGLNGETLEITLEVTNLAGHKFPTGFPSRLAWIHLTVTDADGAAVFDSGSFQADGRIIGNDADTDATVFEPHYDVITSADQVQIYETVMLNSDSEVTNTLLRAAAYAKDNRLLPRGFDKATADEAVSVRGDARTDANFAGGSDQVTYRIDVGGFAGPFTVEAELLYTSVSFRYATEVRAVGTDLADAFGDLADVTDMTPTVVAAAATVTSD